jgi:hypothetical protein
MIKNHIMTGYLIDDFEGITPEEINELTGIEADMIWTKGKPKPKFNVLALKNRWLISAPYEEETEEFDIESFDKQMKYLMDILNSKKDIFKMLGQKYNCEISCGVYIYTDAEEESTPSVHLTKEHSHFLSEFNLEFDVDIILLAEY